MSNYTDLKTALDALANELDDDVRKYTCLALIDQYVDALEAQATTVSTDVLSYTIGGRTVSRTGVQQMQGQVNNLQKQINDILYGNVSYADFRDVFSGVTR